MISNLTSETSVGNSEESTQAVDFLYKQIKELWDNIEKYQENTGNFAESRAIIRGTIIEKKNKGGYVLYKDNYLFVTATDFSPSGKEALEIEIHTTSPIINKAYPAEIEKKRVDLNISKIKKLIKNRLEKIKLKEFAIENNYNLLEKNKIEKRIDFGWNNKDEIILLRAEILKLYEDSNILTVKQVNLNSYNIICQWLQFNIYIAGSYLIINWNLEDIIEIEKIYPQIDEIIKKKNKIFVKKETKDVSKETSWWLRKLFSRKKTERRSTITELSHKDINKMIDNIQANISSLYEFKSNLEKNFPNALNTFDDGIKKEVKEVLIELLDEILKWSEEISKKSTAKLILYISYLIEIFYQTTNKKNPNLTALYKYILSKKDLYSKYGKKIKNNILQDKQYKKNLFFQLLSCWTTKDFSKDKEDCYDMIFSEDNMQIVYTDENKQLNSYNLILKENKDISPQKKLFCRDVAPDGKYIFSMKKWLITVSNVIIDLQNNRTIRPGEDFDNNRKYKYILHGDFAIVINHWEYINSFQVYNIIKDEMVTVDIFIDENKFYINNNRLTFFEKETKWVKTKRTTFNNGISSYNLLNDELKSLNYLINPGDKLINIYGTDSNTYIIIRDKNNKLILRNIDSRNLDITNNEYTDIDISCFDKIFQSANIYISNDGYILLQDKNDLYIINTKDNYKIYKITPKIRLHHIFKVSFVNSPIYGHFAICRDGNQIHKIDIGLIENLEKPIYMEDLKNELEKENEEKSSENNAQKNTEYGEIMSLWSNVVIDRDELNQKKKSELQIEIITELKETRALNSMILKQLEESKKAQLSTAEELKKANQINASMLETIKQLTDILWNK